MDDRNGLGRTHCPPGAANWRESRGRRVAVRPLGVELRDDAAGRWLTERGIQTEESTSAYIYVDEISHPLFAARRIFLRGVQEMRLKCDPEGGGRVELVVTGEMLVRGTTASRLRARDGVFLSAGESLVVGTRGQMAFMDLVFSASFARRAEAVIDGVDSMLLRGGHAWSIMTSFVNSLFAAPQVTDDRGWPLLAAAGEDLAIAMLYGSRQAPTLVGTQRRQESFARAIAIVERDYIDPGFTPQLLADRLNVSLDGLRKIFAAAGTSPFKEIRAARLRHVEHAMRGQTFRGGRLDGLAREAGFSGAKALRRARDSYAGEVLGS